MAGGMDLGSTSGKGAKRPLDTPINLVPFIDLMAVTISFLIMTAVWTQVGRLEVTQRSGPALQDDERGPDLPVIMLITTTELKLEAGGTTRATIPLMASANGASLDLEKLVNALAEVHSSAPGQRALTVRSEDAVRYDVLVKIIDTCIGAGLPDVSVEAAG